MNLHSASLLTALLGIVIYLNTLDNDFVYDDIPAIKRNRDLRPQSPWTGLLVHDFWGASMDNPTSHKSYRPLCVATFRLNYLFHELQPMGYHLVNILLHGAVCYLYVQLCGLVFSQVWPALIAGLLFAVHPIHTEAVVSLVGRAEILCAMFFILCLLAYRKALDKNRGGGVNMKWLVVSMSLSVCALLSKEQGLTSLIMCLILDFCVVHKINFTRLLKPTFNTPPSSPVSKSFTDDIKSLQEQQDVRPFFQRGLIVGMVGLISLVARVMVSRGTPGEVFFDRNINPPLFQPSPYRQLSWFHLTFVNSWIILHPSSLCADWRFGIVPLINSLIDPNNLLTLVTMTTICVLVVFGLSGREQEHRVTMFGLSLIVFPYLPASNLFFPVGFVVAERVLYLPSMGTSLLVAYGAWKMIKRIRNNSFLKSLIATLFCCLLITQALKTFHRNRVWKSNTSLYQSVVRANPYNALMMNNLGLQFVQNNDYTQAAKLYQTSMKLSPNYTGSFYNYGKLMSMAQQYNQAEEPLRKAISVGESVGNEHKRVAESYHLLIQSITVHPSRIDEAHSLVDLAISKHPNNAKLLTDKCFILDRVNRTLDAVQWCREAIQMNSALSRAHYQLGVAYMKLGRADESERSFRDMLFLESDSTLGMFHLATLLQRRGDKQGLREARQLWQTVISLEPTNVDALLNLAQVYDSLTITQQALTTINEILQLQPNHKQALYQAAELLYRHGNISEALRVLKHLYNVDKDYMDVRNMITNIEKNLLSQ